MAEVKPKADYFIPVLMSKYTEMVSELARLNAESNQMWRENRDLREKLAALNTEADK